MTPEQWHWLNQVGIRIRSLLQAIGEGNIAASTAIGERVIDGRRVRLTLLVEVVDPGANPLQSHASACYPGAAISKERPITEHARRRRVKRW